MLLVPSRSLYPSRAPSREHLARSAGDCREPSRPLRGISRHAHVITSSGSTRTGRSTRHQQPAPYSAGGSDTAERVPEDVHLLVDRVGPGLETWYTVAERLVDGGIQHRLAVETHGEDGGAIGVVDARRFDGDRFALRKADVVTLGQRLQVAFEVGEPDRGVAVTNDELVPLPFGVAVGRLAAEHAGDASTGGDRQFCADHHVEHVELVAVVLLAEHCGQPMGDAPAKLPHVVAALEHRRPVLRVIDDAPAIAVVVEGVLEQDRRLRLGRVGDVGRARRARHGFGRSRRRPEHCDQQAGPSSNRHRFLLRECESTVRRCGTQRHRSQPGVSRGASPLSLGVDRG